MTLEEKQAKFNELVSLMVKAKKIMAEFNSQEDCEDILSIEFDKWGYVNQIHLAGYGDQETVDVINLDEIGKPDEENNELYTVVNGVKVFMLKWGNE